MGTRMAGGVGGEELSGFPYPNSNDVRTMLGLISTSLALGPRTWRSPIDAG